MVTWALKSRRGSQNSQREMQRKKMRRETKSEGQQNLRGVHNMPMNKS